METIPEEICCRVSFQDRSWAAAIDVKNAIDTSALGPKILFITDHCRCVSPILTRVGSVFSVQRRRDPACTGFGSFLRLVEGFREIADVELAGSPNVVETPYGRR